MESALMWSNFIKSGKVEDYLIYKESLKANEKPQYDGEVYNEDEHRWTDTQRTEYW